MHALHFQFFLSLRIHFFKHIFCAMKQVLLFLTLILLNLNSLAQQDTIQNAGFEDWGTNPFYDEPIGWTTLNPLASILGSELAYQTTDPTEYVSGSFGIRLETTEISGVGTTPSILTNGTINTSTQEVEGGTPINSRPLGFGGWYRFDPVNLDTGFVTVTLTRWDAVNGVRVLVGTAEADLSDTQGQFVNDEIEFEYLDPETPDTVQILFGSGTDVDPQLGTNLYLDDLYYTYPQSVVSPRSIGLNLFPNPVSDVLNIITSKKVNLIEARIFSIEGKELMIFPISGLKPTINLSALRTGVYIIDLMSSDGTHVRQSLIRK